MNRPRKIVRMLPGAAILLATIMLGCQPMAPTAGVVRADAQKLLKAREKGANEAGAARARGALLLKEYPPLPSPPEHGEYIKLLKEKCNCDYEVVQMKEYSEEVRDEVIGWNDIMKAEIQSKHGPAIFDELRAEARKRWEARAKAKVKT